MTRTNFYICTAGNKLPQGTRALRNTRVWLDMLAQTLQHILKALKPNSRHAGFELLLILSEHFVSFGENYLVRDCVTPEETEDISVVLLDAVFAVDEDEGSAKSGLAH